MRFGDVRPDEQNSRRTLLAARLENKQIRNCRAAVLVFEVLKSFRVQPIGVRPPRFECHLHPASSAVFIVPWSLRDFWSRIRPGRGPTPRAIGHLLAEPHANFGGAR